MHRYSPGEAKLLKLLRYKPVDTEELCKEFYKTGNEPYNGRVVIINTVRSLTRKVALNREPFRVKKTAQAGPTPMKVWLERRAS